MNKYFPYLWGSLLLFFWSTLISAQQFHTLSGSILDASSGEPLIGASVILIEQSEGVATNNYGFYSLNLPQGTYQIQVSYIGFKTHNETIELQKDTQYSFALTP